MLASLSNYLIYDETGGGVGGRERGRGRKREKENTNRVKRKDDKNVK